MKILITGGAGFIGSNAAEYFYNKGNDVIVLDNFSRKGANENGDRLNKLRGKNKIQIEKVDIRDFDALKKVFKANKDAKAVIHLAGQVAVTTSVVNPREDFDINAGGTFNLLESVREMGGSPLVLFASTNKVYGGLEHVRVSEDKERYKMVDYENGVPESCPLDFHSPYGCSKGAADQYIHDYNRIYDVKSVVFRQSCIYGQNQLGIEDQGWVAWFCIATFFKKAITIYGNGKQVRDVLCIDDLLALYEKAIDNPERSAGQIYNVGGGPKFTLSLIELITLLEEKMKRKIPLTHSDWRPGDQPIYISDIAKAKKDLNWEPKITPSKGVDQLFVWVKNNTALIEKCLFAKK